MKFRLGVVFSLFLLGCQPTVNPQLTDTASQAAQPAAEEQIPEALKAFFLEAANLIAASQAPEATDSFQWWSDEEPAREYSGYQLEGTLDPKTEAPYEKLEAFFTARGFTLQSAADGEGLSARTFQKGNIICLLRDGYATAADSEEQEGAHPAEDELFAAGNYVVEISCGLR